MNTQPTTNVFFLVPPEVQLLDLTGPAHIFYEARNYGAPIRLTYLAIQEHATVTSGAGMHFGNLEYYQTQTLQKGDILFIPGMESELFFAEDFRVSYSDFLEWLNELVQQGVQLCTVCTGAYFLGYAGLFNGKNCTTHWKYFDDFSERFKKAQLQRNRLLIKDGPLYSSAGVSSGIDLSLFILEERFGPLFTAKIAKEVVIYFRRNDTDPQLSAFLNHRNHMDTRIHLIQDLISQNLENNLTIEQLAEQVHMSPRNLTRTFKNTLGITMGHYVEKLRLELAQKLLKEGEKVNTVSKMCGLKSNNQLRSIFKKNNLNLPSKIK